VQVEQVTFNGVAATVASALPTRLIVTAPQTASTGDVVVSVGAKTSNALTFTVLSQVEVARGFESGRHRHQNTSGNFFWKILPFEQAVMAKFKGFRIPE
jgi:hypothetical protein